MLNYDKIKDNISSIPHLAALISGKYACSYCAYKGEICESSYLEHSCIDGITEFLSKEYTHKSKK